MDSEEAVVKPAPASRIGFEKDKKQKVRLYNRKKYLENFSANQQTWKLFTDQIRGMFLTGLFLAAMIITLVVYQRNGTTDYRGRLVYNTVSTGLSLGLGLNFFEVFKDMAKVVRWRILSSRPFSVREVDMVMGSESLITTFTLFIESWRKPLIMTCCLAWILLNIIAQATVAIMPLFFSLERGTDSSSITLAPGNVSVPKLDCYRRNNETDCPVRRETVPALAHAYGEAGAAANGGCRYGSDDDINNAPQSCDYFRSNSSSEFAFRYVDLAPNDFERRNFPYLGAGRILKVSVPVCNDFHPPGPGTADSVTDGKNDEWVWSFSNDTVKDAPITIPKSQAAFNATTYIWNGTQQPIDETHQKCGPRCVFVYALRNMAQSDGSTDTTIFQCQIQVSNVSNVTDPAHRLGDGLARMAAASISQTGRWRVPPESKDADWRQFNLFQYGSYWALELYDPPETVGARIAEFAIASLAIMARRNPPTSVQGTVPTLGYQLSVEWKWVILIASCIAGAHVLFVAFILWISRPVAVADDSFLVSAYILRRLVEPLPDVYDERLLDEKGIAREIADAVGKKETLVGGEESKGLLGGPLQERKGEWPLRGGIRE